MAMRVKDRSRYNVRIRYECISFAIRMNPGEFRVNTGHAVTVSEDLRRVTEEKKPTWQTGHS